MNYGIVAEFNPFHNGHKYLIDTAKREGAEAVVCVMSGNAVQRGECAIADKYIRAEMALAGGADLVLELPYPWCAASAEFFASCGVRIASSFADTLIFGSEIGELSALAVAAEICSDDSFAEEYKEALSGNSGTAKTYFELLEGITGERYSSNDILGIEYIKAIKRQGSGIGLRTVRREGAAYRSEDLTGAEYQSATAIRRLISEGKVKESLSDFMPEECAGILMRAIVNGEITDIKNTEQAVRMFFRLCKPSDFEGIADVDEGLASRLCRCADESAEGELLEVLRTKRYTDARLRRAMLFCMTGVRREDIGKYPEYVNLLGVNNVGREILAARRKDSPIAVIAKQADVSDTPAAIRQRELSRKLDAIFSLSTNQKHDTAYLMKKPPVIKGR